MNSLLKAAATEPTLFFFPTFCPSSLCFCVCVRVCVCDGLVFSRPSINAISHRNCPILPLRHMWGGDTHRGGGGGCRVFRAMGLAWDASCNTKPIMEV